jgi:ubiquinone/menaquinone biosynthesis C-methylase UbiE
VGLLMDRAALRIALQQPGFWRGRVLVVCAGMGPETDLVRGAGACSVVALDVSLQGLIGLRQRGSSCHLVVGDASRLPFRDGAFDAALVRQGLHHLPDPPAGVRELWRVTRRGFAFCEAQDSPVTRLAVALGVSTDEEEAGNIVYRFSRRRLRELFHELGVRHYRIYTLFASANMLLEQHVYRRLDRFPGLAVIVPLHRALNAVLGRWGNALVALVLKA